MPVLNKPLITIDGNLSDWIPSERIDYGDVAGYTIVNDVSSRDNFLADLPSESLRSAYD